MDKFHILYNELACNFRIGLEPFRGPFKAALDAYIDERIGLVKPVEGKNAAVSTEGNAFTVNHPDLMLVPTSTVKTVPLPVVGRCKDCKHWERIGRYGKCNNVVVERGAHEADFSDVNVQGKFIVGESFGCVHFEAKGGA